MSILHAEFCFALKAFRGRAQEGSHLMVSVPSRLELLCLIPLERPLRLSFCATHGALAAEKVREEEIVGLGLETSEREQQTASRIGADPYASHIGADPYCSHSETNYTNVIYIHNDIQLCRNLRAHSKP